MRHTSQTPSGNALKNTLAAVISLLTAVGFALIGLWSGQPVFFFMAGSVLFISVDEVSSPHQPDMRRKVGRPNRHADRDLLHTDLSTAR